MKSITWLRLCSLRNWTGGLPWISNYFVSIVCAPVNSKTVVFIVWLCHLLSFVLWLKANSSWWTISKSQESMKLQLLRQSRDINTKLGKRSDPRGIMIFTNGVQALIWRCLGGNLNSRSNSWALDSSVLTYLKALCKTWDQVFHLKNFIVVNPHAKSVPPPLSSE